MASYGGISLKNKKDSLTICSDHDFFIGEVREYLDGVFDEFERLITCLDSNEFLLPSTKTWLDDLKKYLLLVDKNNICDIAKLMMMKDLVFFYRQDVRSIDEYVSSILEVDSVSGERKYLDIYGSGKKATEYLGIKDVFLSSEFKVARIVHDGSDRYIDIKYKGISEKELIVKIHQLPVFISELFYLSKKGFPDESSAPDLISFVGNKVEFYNNKRKKDTKYPIINTENKEIEFINEKLDGVNRLIPLCFSAAELASAITMMLPANIYPLTDGESLYSSKIEPSLKIYLAGDRMVRFYSIHESDDEFDGVSADKFLNTCSRIDALWNKIEKKNLSGLKTVFVGGDKESRRVYTDVDMDIVIQVNPFDYL